jgi:predicted RNase H-like HicB family nuclease
LRRIKVIEIIVTQHGDDYWGAGCEEFPWITAEGATRFDVVREISQISPVILMDAGVEHPYRLDWKSTKAGAS